MGEIVFSGFNFGNLASLMNHWFSGETNLEWKLLKWKISPISPMPEKFNCPIQILEVTGFWTLIYQLIAHELRVQFRSGEQVEAMSTVCDTRHEPSQTFPLGENVSGSPDALVGELFKTIKLIIWFRNHLLGNWHLLERYIFLPLTEEAI